MAATLHHRGPDDLGVWVDDQGVIALGHTRLSVLDLSTSGHQPMESTCGRYVLVYNGEIYNHQRIRRLLEAEDGFSQWRGHSDTETLLACLSCRGVEDTLRIIQGMFAFAVWDRQQDTLYLARDRMGEKPLYYGWQGNCFIFGSELKALKAHPAFTATIDRGALALLLRYNYVPGPYSIYAGIRKLPPGSFLKLGIAEQAANACPDATPYWSLAEVTRRGVGERFRGTEAEALDLLEETLGTAIDDQMLSDVPLGFLLSGGIDSSLVCALARGLHSQPIRTFSIGFEDGTYDESGYARKVAAHLGSTHTEMVISPEDALDLIHGLPTIYDEPFADSSQLPTLLVMTLVRQHVTVALSGDGGDELFGGYNRYRYAPGLWRRLSRLPGPARKLLAACLTALPADLTNRLSGTLGIAQFGDKAHKLGKRLGHFEIIDDFYLSLLTEWPDAAGLVPGAQTPRTLLDEQAAWPSTASPEERMMLLDGLTYLPDDILTKVDRAAMAVSLETRTPFLDRRVIELAWRLPLEMKIREGQGKYLLSRLLGRHVPPALFERPKMGFGIPLDQWLRGPLRDWAEELLREHRILGEGYLNPGPIRKAWGDHLSGRSNHGYRLWSVLMFQLWLEQQP